MGFSSISFPKKLNNGTELRLVQIKFDDILVAMITNVFEGLHDKNGLLSILGGFMVDGFVAITNYILAFRPWHFCGGSTDKEVVLLLPGDDLMPNAKLIAIQFITSTLPKKIL